MRGWVYAMMLSICMSVRSFVCLSPVKFVKSLGSLKISRRNPCSPFFSVSYSINRHKIL